MKTLRPTIVLVLLFVVVLPLGRMAHADALSFADSLYHEGDYYRAVTEYKRFLHQQPTATAAARAQLNIARCYLYAERWQQAEHALETLQGTYPHSEEQDYASLLYAEIPYKQGKFSLISQRAHHLAPRSPQLLSHLQNLRLWALAQQQQYDDALNTIAQSPDTVDLTADDIWQLQQLPYKSPRLAGTLSAIVPGAGQLYAKRYREAGMALVLNAAFLLGGLQAIDSGNEILGGILLFFEAGWYGGNIYNAVNSTHKHNRQLEQSLLQQLSQRYRFSLLLDNRATILTLSAPLD